MIIKPSISVLSSDRVEARIDLDLFCRSYSDAPESLALEGAVAFSPLINSHDHLIGNWFPRAGDKRPYHNSHIWVEDMKSSFSFQERNQFWFNDGSFDLSVPHALVLAQLGCYKSLFGGAATVQDHGPNQAPLYYDSMPISVLKDYRQCHSITMENWWGGESPEAEMQLSAGKIPYIIHLGEGTDNVTRAEFSELTRRKLLQANTLLIHGIAFTEDELRQIAAAKASVCWCPTSNYYLIGETLKVEAALQAGVNVCIGTDSTMSGGINLISEFILAHEKFPALPLSTLYKMASENGAKALMLPPRYGFLQPDRTENMLLMDLVDRDPFRTLLAAEAENIRLLVRDGIPLFGDSQWLEWLDVDMEKYSTFRTGSREKFVIGDPQELNDRIDAVLGYHKDFPYLPF
ncbi:MAG TPA: amidohydrolase family protein [Candidatus Cloacimonadota bacterium]|nr:amidohydrolase family protein [Candidatus Cloacimonadota bacterium]